ncbi:MAG: type I-C CRISPR-associated endonuclease Cas1c [Christensenellales bacterium]
MVRKLLNTLYIMQDDVYLKLDGLNIVLTKNSKQVARLPFCNLESIVCFNYLGCSPQLMAKCVEEGVGLCFLKPTGEFLARVTGKVKGNVHLRVMQYEKLRDDNICLYLAKQTIMAKIINSKSYLAKQARENASVKVYIEDAIKRIDESAEKIDVVKNLDALRGIEGCVAKEYFGEFKNILKNEDFKFESRNKRPPLDPVNAVLSYLYTLLALDCQSALETVGLDSYVGYFHTDRSGRASLALDIMEEFRCFIVDRCVISLFNKKQLNGSHFEKNLTGAVSMTEEGKKIILTEWQSRKKEEIKHPIIKEKVPIGLLPYVQARLLSKFIRGEMEKYTPFEIKL